jgi:hypothetical protein
MITTKKEKCISISPPEMCTSSAQTVSSASDAAAERILGVKRGMPAITPSGTTDITCARVCQSG